MLYIHVILLYNVAKFDLNPKNRRSVLWLVNQSLQLEDNMAVVEERLDKNLLRLLESNATIMNYWIVQQRKADFVRNCLKIMMRNQPIVFCIL